jgi:hypothetical protein
MNFIMKAQIFSLIVIAFVLLIPTSILAQSESIVTMKISCGEGTIKINGECVLDTNYKSTSQPSSKDGSGKVSIFQKIVDFMDEPFLSMEKAVGGDGHKRPHTFNQAESQKDVITSPYCWNIMKIKVCIFS